MENYDVRNYIRNKAFAQNIVNELSLIFQKFGDKSLKVFERYENLNVQLYNAKTIFQAEQISKSLDEAKEQLVFVLSILDKLERIIEKNKKRIKYLDQRIKLEKVTNFSFSKKDMNSLLQSEKITISEKDLNLNANEDQGVIPTYFCEHIFQVENKEISLTNEKNYAVLSSLEDKEFKIVMDKFPKTLLTISDKQLLDVKFKHRILRQIISICDAKLKSDSAYEINEYFGNPLYLNTKIPNTINDFVDEIKNLFNVRTKQYVIQEYPYLENYANNKLICDEGSETLPRKYIKREIEEDESLNEDLAQLDEMELFEKIEQENNNQVKPAPTNILESNVPTNASESSGSNNNDDDEEDISDDEFNKFLMDLIEGTSS